MPQSYEQTLLEGWEDVFKKSQLTMWILLALKDGPKHMATIKQFILEATNGLIDADDKSMYRALRRYQDAQMVDYKLAKTRNGPDRKIYRLTDVGLGVLKAFVRRNILDVFFKPAVKRLLQS